MYISTYNLWIWYVLAGQVKAMPEAASFAEHHLLHGMAADGRWIFQAAVPVPQVF